jgi:hypothetical protein
MRTLRLSLAGTVILMLLGGAGSMVAAQDDASGETEAMSDVVWELAIPSEAIPDDFVKLVMEDWTLDPGIDTGGEYVSVLGNEALRGRGLVIESGEVEITPATEAMLWRGAQGDPELSVAGEPVRLGIGDAIYLPAIPDADVDKEAPMAFANPGSEPATARSFHLHQNGGSFYGYLPGITLGPWDMAGGFDDTTHEAMNGVDILLRLTRMTGAPGASMPAAAAPAFGLYFVEDGDVEEVTSGPGGEFVYDWPAGQNGLLPPRTEGVEAGLRVTGDGEATLFEFAAIPQGSASDLVEPAE